MWARGSHEGDGAPLVRPHAEAPDLAADRQGEARRSLGDRRRARPLGRGG